MQNFNVGKEFLKLKETFVKLQFLKIEKKEIENDIEDCMPNCIQTLSDMPRGNTTSDSTANTAAQIEDHMIKLRKKNREIDETERKIETVELLIQTLKKEDQDLINKRIKEKKKWETIQVELYEQYNSYTHYKSVERRYNDIIAGLQRKLGNM